MADQHQRMTAEQFETLGETVTYFKDVLKLKWADIGRKTNVPPESCRNAYRKYKMVKSGRSTTPQPNRTHSTSEGETFEDNSEDENNRQISSMSDRITTLDQLLAFSKVDLDVWEVDHFQINKWEGFRAAKSNDLTFTAGVMDGWTKDTGDVVIAPLFQVKAWLIRKNPAPLTPFVSRVTVMGHSHPKKAHERSRMGLALVFFDVHMAFRNDLHAGKLEPLHDRRAMNIISQIAAALPFSDIILGGDGFDFPQLTDKFLHSPEFDYTLQPSLNEMAWWLAEISSACPNARKYFIEGNHDVRFYNYMISRVPQIYNVRTRQIGFAFWELRNLLSLEEMGWEWKGPYPDGEVWITDNLRVVHGVETSADSLIKKSDVSTIFGHIHRVEQSSRTVWSRGKYRTVHSFCPGFLGRMDGVIPGVRGKQNWSQGFCIVEYDRDGETINHVPIYNGSAIYDRSRWIGEDYGNKF